MKINQQLQDSLDNISKELEKKYVVNREEMIDLLTKFATDVTKKTGKSTAQLLDEYNKSNKKIRDRYKREQREEATEVLRTELNNKRIVKGYNKLNKGLKTFNVGMVDFTKAMTPVTSPLSELTSTLANVLPLFGVTAIIAAGASFIDNLTNTYASLTKTGIQVSGGLLGSIEATARMGLSFEEGAKLFSDNALTIQQYGLPAISAFTDNLRNSSSELFALGLTVKDVSQQSIAFLDIQRKIDSSNQMDLSQREGQFTDQLKKFYNVTQIVGQDLGSLMDQYRKTAEDPLGRLFLQSLPEETREAFIAFQKVAPQEAEAMQQAFFRGGNINRIDNYEEYARIGAIGDLQKMYDQFFNAEATNESIFGIFAEREAYYERQFATQSDMMQMQAATRAATLAKLGNLVNTEGANISTKVDDLTKGVVTAQQAINNFYYNLKVAFLEQLQHINFDDLAVNIEKISKNIANLILGLRKFSDENPITPLTDNIATAANALSDTGETARVETAATSSPFPMLLTGIAGAFVMAASSSMLRSIILDSVSSYASGMRKLIGSANFSIPGIEGLQDFDLTDPFGEKKRAASAREQARTRPHGSSTVKPTPPGSPPPRTSTVPHIPRNSATSAASSAAEVVEQVAKRRSSLLARASGIIARATGKTIVKSLPVIGAVGGLAFGASRLLEGDFIGAGLEVTAGVAGIVPGVGTAASITASLGLLAKDLFDAGFTPDEISEIIEETKKELMGSEVVPNVSKLTDQQLTQQLATAQQDLQKSQEEELAAKQEIPDAPLGLSRGARKKWQEDRAKLRKEIEAQYEDRNSALRAAIGALQYQIRENEKLNQVIPDSALMP